MLFFFQLSQDLRKSDPAVDKELQNVFENFDMSQIKRAGSIFDGFCVSKMNKYPYKYVRFLLFRSEKNINNIDFFMLTK